MAVNGIEIKVGQVWQTRGSGEATILRTLDPCYTRRYWVADMPAALGLVTFSDEGQRFSTRPSMYDLVTLIQETNVRAKPEFGAAPAAESAAAQSKERSQYFRDMLDMSGLASSVGAKIRLSVTAEGPQVQSQAKTTTNTTVPEDVCRGLAQMQAAIFGQAAVPGNNLDQTIGGILASGIARAAAANDTQVGDLHSDAKGSGARFNAGKAPYDLVPLQLMADYYAMTDDLPGINDLPSNPVAAMGFLGLFQGRDEATNDDSTHLMHALIELGDGWEECARVFEYGARKYKKNNWLKGMAWSVPLACATRHLLAMIKGEELDPESGLSHRGHFFCNAAMLLTFLDTHPEGDDRPDAGMLCVAAA